MDRRTVWGVVLCLLATTFFQTVAFGEEKRVRLLTRYRSPIELSAKKFPLYKKDYPERKKTQAMVFFFLGPDCPLVARYVPTMKKLHKTYEKRGIEFYGVYSGATQEWNVREMAKHAYRFELPFPVFLDKAVSSKDPRFTNNHVQMAKKYGVRFTTEALVLSPSFEVLYKGKIDDKFFQGGAKERATEFPLKNAIEDVLAGRAVEVKKTEAQGCAIDKEAFECGDKHYTFFEHIAPILQAKCTTCHRQGGGAPNYFDFQEDKSRAFRRAWARRHTIGQVVEDRLMPPWPAEIGERNLRFKNHNTLSADQIEKIVCWSRQEERVKSQGKASAFKVQPWPDPAAWTIGKKKEELHYYQQLPTVTIPADKVSDYVYYWLPLDSEKFKDYVDKDGNAYASHVEVRPAQSFYVRRAIHHIQVLEAILPNSVFRNLEKKARKKLAEKLERPPTEKEVEEELEQLSRQPVSLNGFAMVQTYNLSLEKARLVGAYTPGNGDRAKVYPEDRGMLIRGGDTLDGKYGLLFELHLTPFGEELKATPELGMVFRKDKPEFPVHSKWQYRHRHFGKGISPRHPYVKMVSNDEAFERRSKLLSVRTHLHLCGKDFTVKLLPRVGSKKKPRTLLYIPSWDFNWQLQYYLMEKRDGKWQEGVIVEPGERLAMEAHWDNTAVNPANTDPNKPKRWGQQSEQEMFAMLATWVDYPPSAERKEKEGNR